MALIGHYVLVLVDYGLGEIFGVFLVDVVEIVFEVFVHEIVDGIWFFVLGVGCGALLRIVYG